MTKPSLAYQLAEANDRTATLAARVVAETELSDALAEVLRELLRWTTERYPAAKGHDFPAAVAVLARYDAARGAK